jgi:hypothetical protein
VEFSTWKTKKLSIFYVPEILVEAKWQKGGQKNSWVTNGLLKVRVFKRTV